MPIESVNVLLIFVLHATDTYIRVDTSLSTKWHDFCDELEDISGKNKFKTIDSRNVGQVMYLALEFGWPTSTTTPFRNSKIALMGLPRRTRFIGFFQISMIQLTNE